MAQNFSNPPISQALYLAIKSNLRKQKALHLQKHRLEGVIVDKTKLYNATRNAELKIQIEKLESKVARVRLNQSMHTSKRIAERWDVSPSTVSKIKNSSTEFNTLPTFKVRL